MMVSDPVLASQNSFNANYEIPSDLIEETQKFVLNYVNSHQWKEGNLLTRTTLNFGWNFVELEENHKVYIELPDVLKTLRSLVFKLFKDKIADGETPETFNNAIVSIYETGHFLEPHIDCDFSRMKKKGLCYSFGEAILGVIIEADEQGCLKFFFHDQEGKPNISQDSCIPIQEKSGMAFLIQGPLRYAPYYHGVSTVLKRRISITFRKVYFDECPL